MFRKSSIGHMTSGHLDMNGGHLENAEYLISERKVMEMRDRFLNPCFRVKKFKETCCDLGHMIGGHLEYVCQNKNCYFITTNEDRDMGSEPIPMF